MATLLYLSVCFTSCRSAAFLNQSTWVLNPGERKFPWEKLFLTPCLLCILPPIWEEISERACMRQVFWTLWRRRDQSAASPNECFWSVCKSRPLLSSRGRSLNSIPWKAPPPFSECFVTYRLMKIENNSCVRVLRRGVESSQNTTLDFRYVWSVWFLEG